MASYTMNANSRIIAPIYIHKGRVSHGEFGTREGCHRLRLAHGETDTRGRWYTGRLVVTWGYIYTEQVSHGECVISVGKRTMEIPQKVSIRKRFYTRGLSYVQDVVTLGYSECWTAWKANVWTNKVPRGSLVSFPDRDGPRMFHPLPLSLLFYLNPSTVYLLPLLTLPIALLLPSHIITTTVNLPTPLNNYPQSPPAFATRTKTTSPALPTPTTTTMTTTTASTFTSS